MANISKKSSAEVGQKRRDSQLQFGVKNDQGHSCLILAASKNQADDDAVEHFWSNMASE